jgi:glycosyltransferase involved in cell wall biosynthesis
VATQPMPRVAILDLLSVVPFYDQRLVEQLRLTNPNVRLIAVSPHRDPQYFEDRDMGARDLIADWVARMPGGLLDRVQIRRAAKAIEYHLNVCLLTMSFLRRPPDVLHTQWLPMLGRSPIDTWFVKLLNHRGIPLVHTVHNVLPHDDDSDRTKAAYARLYRSATLLICHTEEAARQVTDEFHVPRQRIEVIPHGPLFGATADVSGADVERVAGVDAGSHVLLTLGVIRPYKGLEFLLRAWQRVDTPNAHLVIAGVGDPRYIGEIVDLVRDFDLGETVDLRPGYVPDAEHDALHRTAEIVVLPYQHINQSGALMTAMAYGRAIVATDVGGFPEVIENGRNGILVPYGDTEALAKALTNLLRDPDRREELGCAAMADTTTTLSWESISAKTSQAYQRAVRSHQETRQK